MIVSTYIFVFDRVITKRRNHLMSEKKNGKGWFKGVLSTRGDETPDGQVEYEGPELPSEASVNEAIKESTTYKNIFSRENQEKVTLDLVVAVENMLNDRQILVFKNKGLSEQLQDSLETIQRLKSEQSKRDQQIQNYEKEIYSLEDKLTNKQMTYDQLIEDYKEYQSSSKLSIENLKFQLEKEQSKYTKLNEELTRMQFQQMQQTKDLEEKVRDLEAENQKINEQYQKISEEKAQLLHTINDFTARMSFSFNAPNQS